MRQARATAHGAPPMSDPKDGGFLRKMVRFVANPATDWHELGTRGSDTSHDLERAELKAMIERKKRNDFVRKREFETLRRLRRDGLSPEQLAALGGAGRQDDDSEARLGDTVIGARAEVGVKAKIDEIELAFDAEAKNEGRVSSAGSSTRRPVLAPKREPVPSRPSDFFSQPTQPATPTYSTPLPPLDNAPHLVGLDHPLGGAARRARSEPRHDSSLSATTQPMAMPGATRVPELWAPAPAPWAPTAPAGLGKGGPASAGDLPPLPPLPPLPSLQAPSIYDTQARMAVDVNEVVHDPDLDEAVIAFANADFSTCERALTALCQNDGPRHGHADTWLVLFDLFRATGQQAKFDALSLDYATLFHRSSPQWFSMPRQVADAAAEERPDTRGLEGQVAWVAPNLLDTDAVARLRSTTLQLPLPWVLDWSGTERVEPEAASQLQSLFRLWAPQALDMRWIAADRLITALQEAAPTGVRDGDPAFWMARLEALRLANRPDQFDETAIDYCVTYEVSPPSWEKVRCSVRLAGPGGGVLPSAPMSIIGEVSTSFLETGQQDDIRAVHQVATVELSGQLAGDISATLAKLDKRLGTATLAQVNCSRLIRVDFNAAGDLLNWVLTKQSQERQVTFAEAHRLVALFFGAMGINEHARVQVTRQ